MDPDWPPDINLPHEPLNPVGKDYHLKLPKLCVAHRGADPVWHGRPTAGRIRLITSLTTHNSTGQFYWRAPGETQIRKLRSAEDYRRMQKVLDSWVDFSVR